MHALHSQILLARSLGTYVPVPVHQSLKETPRRYFVLASTRQEDQLEYVSI